MEVFGILISNALYNINVFIFYNGKKINFNRFVNPDFNFHWELDFFFSNPITVQISNKQKLVDCIWM